MTEQLKFSLQRLTIQATIPPDEEFTVGDLADMPMDEVRRRLDEFGLSPEPLVRKVAVEASPMDAIIEAAKDSQLEHDVLRRRVRVLATFSVVGLLGILGTLAAFLGGFVVSENAMAFSGVLVIGFCGVFLGSLWALIHLVLSNAFYARVRSEASEDLYSECKVVLREIEMAEPGIDAHQSLVAALARHPRVRDALAREETYAVPRYG